MLACTAGTNAPGDRRGGGSNGAGGSAGTSGAAGIGGGRGGDDRDRRRHLDGGSGGAGGPPAACRCSTSKRKPAEILLLLDRSKSMIEDTTSDGVTQKWNAVLPALKQVIMDTDAAVSWGLKMFPEGDRQRVCRRAASPATSSSRSRR